MSRREELEKQLEIAQKSIENAPESTPGQVLELMHRELDSIAFELNNLYDDGTDDNE